MIMIWKYARRPSLSCTTNLINYKFGLYPLYQMSIWSLTFQLCQYNPYHYPVDEKISCAKWNNKKLLFMPH